MMKHSIEKLESAELCWHLCTMLSFPLSFLLRHGYERSTTLLLACCFSCNILFFHKSIAGWFSGCMRLYAHSQTVRDCARLYAHSQTVRDCTLIPRLCETLHSFPDGTRLYTRSQTIQHRSPIPIGAASFPDYIVQMLSGTECDLSVTQHNGI